MIGVWGVAPCLPIHPVIPGAYAALVRIRIWGGLAPTPLLPSKDWLRVNGMQLT